jgi:lipoprotein NlpD
MPSTLFKPFFVALISASLMLMVGCSTPRTKPASVTDRSGGSSEPTPPGYYRVKKGDTLARIALDNGQAPRDVVQWNKAANPGFNPNVIEVGDLILIKAPAGTKSARVADKKPAADKSDSPATSPEPAKPEVVAEPGIRKVGEPVLAASDGKVVYAGNSLRGYGNLVIVKHDNTYLTAYAHNSKLLVKEGDAVRKGQRIAEMGDTDANAIKLHFELRVNGKPVNPTPYLQ